MRGWARGIRVALAVALGCAAVGGLGAVVVAGHGGSGDRVAASTRPPVRVKGIVVTKDNPVPTEATSVPAPTVPQTAETVPPATAPAATAPIDAAPPAPAPGPAATTESPPCPDPGGASLVDAFVNGHRAIRCQLGLPDVALDPAMSANAQFHAERLMADGACANLWHSGELPSWYGGGGGYWGENAACMDWSHGCWGDAGRVMVGWMASAEHRPNIVNPNYQWLGVGVACDGRHTYFVVHFRS